ncbi:DUF6678 family protein [Bradyrhizobium iriomotense]|uniref:DUF6678 family protein n=1 Tax=Bradyrhizobium iriomotense TaxID=441950 RepID=UPI001B8A6BA7|nr:DUF6678 family protein [Bradyrhizobium iriomotense]MBR0780320.1 hypothetical protein [Bradyrhizobium iriomotense]
MTLPPALPGDFVWGERMAQQSDYYSVANDTKWRELREAMLSLAPSDQPRFRCKSLETGNLSQWDGEWFHHWTSGGWDWMEWAELATETAHQREFVRAILQRIRFAGEQTAAGFRIYGYIRNGEVAGYIE